MFLSKRYLYLTLSSVLQRVIDSWRSLKCDVRRLFSGLTSLNANYFNLSFSQSATLSLKTQIDQF